MLVLCSALLASLYLLLSVLAVLRRPRLFSAPCLLPSWESRPPRLHSSPSQRRNPSRAHQTRSLNSLSMPSWPPLSRVPHAEVWTTTAPLPSPNTPGYNGQANQALINESIQRPPKSLLPPLGQRTSSTLPPPPHTTRPTNPKTNIPHPSVTRAAPLVPTCAAAVPLATARLATLAVVVGPVLTEYVWAPVAVEEGVEEVRGMEEVAAPTAMVPVTAARPSAVQRSTKAVVRRGERDRGEGRRGGERGRGVSGRETKDRRERTVVVGYDGGAVAGRGGGVSGDAGGTGPCARKGRLAARPREETPEMLN